MGNCYSSSAVNFHENIDTLRIKGKDAAAERPDNEDGDLRIPYSDIVFEETPGSSSSQVPFVHNGVLPFTREERVRVMFSQQKSSIIKLLSRLDAEKSPKPERVISLESTFFDELKQMEGGFGAFARQLGITAIK